MEKNEIPIVCPYCGVGCNLELTLDESGIPVKSKASGRNQQLNQKYLCVKGFSVHEIINSPDRLRHPMVRRNGRLQKVYWDEAIGTAARKLAAIIDRHGPESVGMLSSGKILNEEIYLSQKFQRCVIGNNHVDNCARLCHGPSEAGLRRQLGYGAVSVFFEDYDIAETVFVVGANTTSTHPIIWKRIRKSAKERGINMILADPRETSIIKHATVHLQSRPGTDIYWLKALGKIILSKEWHDKSFCQRHTIGFHAYAESLKDLDIDIACARADVRREDLEKTAELIHDKKTIFIWGMGLTQHAHGTDNVAALVNLALLTGNMGKPGCGVAPLRGQNNVQGACDLGALPNLFPGHMPVDDEAARIHIQALWKRSLSAKIGLSAPEMIHDIASGKIRALYIIGENPAVSEPQSTFVAWMLQRLELLIVQDIYPTVTSQYAHVLFPAAVVGEKAGTYTNAARRIQYTAEGLTPPGEAQADWRIVQRLARAMGHDWNNASTEEIWEEIRQVAPIFSGISHARLRKSPGIFWPCYDDQHPGTPRLYQDGFMFRDRRARFFPVASPRSLMEKTDSYPFVLITGRLLEHFNTGEMSRRSKKLTRSSKASFVEMNRDDAQKAGLASEAPVRVTSPFGSVKLRLKVSDSVSQGYLFAPIHFSRPNFNALLSAVPMDPFARMPALKVVPVMVNKL
ncbi:MAG: formate dehydrogenase subunit alpha [Desulfobacteraceae bacterium]|jgi:formate dehydrogenase alpha subunit